MAKTERGQPGLAKAARISFRLSQGFRCCFGIVDLLSLHADQETASCLRSASAFRDLPLPA
jgi:hypothetical protein